MPRNKGKNWHKKPNDGKRQAYNFASGKKTNGTPTTSQEARKPYESSSVRDPSLDKWLQSNIDNYVTKSKMMLDSILDSKNSDDVRIKKYEELTSFVHESLAEIRKIMDTRRHCSSFEDELVKVECSQMRYDKQIRYLTTPCQRWWTMPGEVMYAFPRKYKNQEPWKGLQDERTACQFVEEFIEMVLPWCWNTSGAILEFVVRLRCDLSDEIDEFVENISCKGTLFADVVKKFLITFSNESVHCKEIVDFGMAYPDDGAVFLFVQFWLGRFRFNPKVDPSWVIDKLIEKLPHRYVSPLLQLKFDKNANVSYKNISTIVYDQAAELKDPIPSERDYLGYHVFSSKLRSIQKQYLVEVPFITDEKDNTPSDYEDEEETSSEDDFNFGGITCSLHFAK